MVTDTRVFEETEMTKLVKLALGLASGLVTDYRRGELERLLRKIEKEKLDVRLVSREE